MENCGAIKEDTRGSDMEAVHTSHRLARSDLVSGSCVSRLYATCDWKPSVACVLTARYTPWEPRARRHSNTRAAARAQRPRRRSRAENARPPVLSPNACKRLENARPPVLSPNACKRQAQRFPPGPAALAHPRSRHPPLRKHLDHVNDLFLDLRHRTRRTCQTPHAGTSTLLFLMHSSGLQFNKARLPAER